MDHSPTEQLVRIVARVERGRLAGGHRLHRLVEVDLEASGPRRCDNCRMDLSMSSVLNQGAGPVDRLTPNEAGFTGNQPSDRQVLAVADHYRVRSSVDRSNEDGSPSEMPSPLRWPTV